MEVPHKHIVIAGFLGSRHDEVAATLAKRLDRPYIDTLTPMVQEAIVQDHYERAIEYEAEAVSHLYCQPPTIVTVRPESLIRGRVHNIVFQVVGASAVRVFLDVPAAIATKSARRYPPDLQLVAAHDIMNDNHLSTKLNAKARADIHLEVGDVSSVPVITGTLLQRLQDINRANTA